MISLTIVILMQSFETFCCSLNSRRCGFSAVKLRVGFSNSNISNFAILALYCRHYILYFDMLQNICTFCFVRNSCADVVVIGTASVSRPDGQQQTFFSVGA